MDPPYGKGLEKEVIEILNTKEFTNPDYTIIIEATLDEDMSYIEDTKFKIYKTKNYKNNKHVFLCAK